MIYLLLLCIIIILLLCYKIHWMRQSMKEIQTGVMDKLHHDTNTLISISSHDKKIEELAVCLNVELVHLRELRQRYQQGDLELKDAVTNISHDLRTPLTAVYGYLDLLEKEDKSEDAARYIHIIKGRMDALKQLTEELFHYSVFLSEAKESFEVVELKRAIEECLSANYVSLKGCHITPEIVFCEQEIKVHINQNALSRILNNIVSNVIKYSTGDFKIVLLNTGEMIFSNHAPALDETTVGKLFDRFYTVENGMKSTGLGLSIAKSLCEQMHGEIYANYKKDILYIDLRFHDRT